MPSSAFPRRLATAAQVYPKVLPYMHAPKPLLRGPALRSLPIYATVACVAYAAATFQSSHSPPEPSPALAIQESHQAEENRALLDAYGGRDSLEQLEAAARLYASQHGQGPQ